MSFYTVNAGNFFSIESVSVDGEEKVESPFFDGGQRSVEVIFQSAQQIDQFIQLGSAQMPQSFRCHGIGISSLNLASHIPKKINKK